jgi:hypothetical protein
MAYEVQEDLQLARCIRDRIFVVAHAKHRGHVKVVRPELTLEWIIEQCQHDAALTRCGGVGLRVRHALRA